MQELVAFIKKTKQLLALLEEGFPKENREQYIDSVNKLLDGREEILKVIPDLSNLLDEDVKQQLINLEKKIESLMGDYLGIIKKDLQVLQLQKKNMTHYSDPYENISADGMFLDKKK